MAHVHSRCPAQGHTDQSRPVAHPPADIGGRLLMRHQPVVARRNLVAESRETRRQRHAPRYGLARIVVEFTAREQHVLAVFHQPHMNMQAGARLPRRYLWGEGDIESLAPGQVSDNPFGDNQLVGGLHGGDRQELYLVLLIEQAVLLEVAHLRVSVFDMPACSGDILHALLSEGSHLRIGRTLMIAVLVTGLEVVLSLLDDIIFQLSHSLEVHPRDSAK